MGKLVGGITDAIGLTDNKGQEKAAKNAAEASAQSLALSKEAIEFQKEQYADWKAIYGDIQENLGDYYKNLTPDRIVSLGLENQQREYQLARIEIDKEFARRGIDPSSGLALNTGANLNFQNAEARAKIRSSGETAVAEEKLRFLGVGLGQGTAMLGNIAGVTTNAAGTQASLAGAYIGQQTDLTKANIGSMGDLIGAGAYLQASRYKG